MGDPLITADEASAAWAKFAAYATAEQSALIASASGLIENACLRPLGLATYREPLAPGRTRAVRLKARPLVELTRLAADPLPLLTATGPAGALRATLAVSADLATITLRSSGRADIALTVASYATLADLAAALAGAGWSAEAAGGYAAWLVADLELRPGVFGGGPGNVGWRAYGYTRDVCDYEADPDLGVLTLGESFWDTYRFPDRRWSPARVAPLLARHSSGYATADVPAPLKRAAILALKSLPERLRAVGPIRSETIGAYSYDLAALPVATRDLVADLINPWIDYGA